MTATTLHWAAALIGKPYKRGAMGPDAYDCWGLVRWVFAQRYGILMPVVNVGDDTLDNVAAIKRASEVSGWQPVADPTAADGDIVLMHGPEGRHVGVMVRADGLLRLLHCIDGAGVCYQPLADVQLAGFSGFVFWRRAS